ncbi:hypothetical protein FRC20_003614 [Serendipita sp. 405]|nr:hypothetical protein FRC20_003614 [Serendipita sp. 405]
MPFDPSFIPHEIWEEVFEWYCVDQRIPSRNLALVCRRWKQILLNHGILWRTIAIDLNAYGSIGSLRDRLASRLSLAKGHTLDVILSNPLPMGLWPIRAQYKALFRNLLTIQAPVHRWYSLSINHGDFFRGDMGLVPEIFDGPFTSLRILSIGWHKTLIGLDVPNVLRFIQRSNPPLRYLRIQFPFTAYPPCHITIPPTLATLSVDRSFLERVRLDAVPSLHEMEISGKYGAAYYPKPINITLLNTLKIQKCEVKVFNSLNVHNVRTLHIDTLISWDHASEISVDLPNLHTLHVRPCLPYYLKVFKAPRLETVKLTGCHKSGSDEQLGVARQENRIHTISLFHKRQHLLVINPMSLTIEVDGITEGTLIAILEAWPQLRHLSLIIGNHFDLPRVFAKQRRERALLLCPQLETMYIEVWWYARGRKWRKWREVARNLISSRNDRPLKSIIWKNKWFDVEALHDEADSAHRSTSSETPEP